MRERERERDREREDTYYSYSGCTHCNLDGFTDEDKVLMKAKINFFGTKVGEHPCVLGFIGAVTEEQPSK